jgi:SH3-like domain-containing protein
VLEDIRFFLTDFSRRDSRFHYCQLDADSVGRTRCRLSGVILDADELADVVAELNGRFPKITFDTTDVRLLSATPKNVLAVATNVTGVLSKPSRQSEQLSQVMNGWPVEVLQESDDWAFVRLEMDGGYLGWVYRPFLVDELPSEGTHMVEAPICLLRAEPEADSDLVGRVFAGMVVGVTAVRGEEAQISLAGGLTGWVQRADIRSMTDWPQTTAERRQQIVNTARQLVGVPYLWGGRTALGIDCSGLAELAYRMGDISIPRDADMQYAAGTAVEPPFQPGDLLFFGSDKGHRAVSHVAISLGGWRIIHASGSRNGVYVDDVEESPSLRDIFIGTRTFF